MKTPGKQLAGWLAMAAVCLGGMAWGVRADEPRLFQPTIRPSGR